ncbi:MAG: hypothetical protein FWF12_08445 [Betaproteobacteria bacterium]|nr:hypothetical protein [Betaproteobacteria bacterium]
MNFFELAPPLAVERLQASALGSFARPYLDYLYEQGYKKDTIRRYFGCISHFAFWATPWRFDLSDLSKLANRFVSEHLPQCRCGDTVMRRWVDQKAALTGCSKIPRHLR